MAVETIVVVFAAFFFAAFVKGTTGLGFSTACLPILTMAIGLKATLPLLIIPSLASNLIVMRAAGHFRATIRRFWPLFLAAIPGLVLGLLLLTRIDQLYAAAVLGLVLILYGLFALANPQLTLPRALVGPLAVPTGLLTGTVNGLTGSQVMPVLPYLLALRLEPDRFVQAINCSFTLSSLVMAVGLTRIGLMTLETAAVSVAGVVFVFLGVSLGNRVRRVLSPEQFRRAVLLLLIAAGGILLVKPYL